MNRRSSLINIDDWLDRCPGDEPDSMIYEPDFCNDAATIRTKQKLPEMESLYKVVTDICTKIGLSPDIVDERLNDIDDCITTFLNTIQQDVQDEYDKLCHYKQDLLTQIQKMMKDLYLPEYVPQENITLLQHCKRLKTKFTELNVVKQARMTRLQELRDKQTKYCLTLGISKPPLLKLQTDIPTEEELSALTRTVLEMEKEEARRKVRYLQLKTDISQLIDELEYESQGKFEESVLTDKPNYSEEYLIDMTNFRDKLKTLHIKNKEKFEKLREKLVSLYERLDTPQVERDLFLSTHSVCSPTTIVEIEIEINHYEMLKKQNIHKFVEKIIEELKIAYESCYYSEEDKNNAITQFTISGDYTEELLERCERELDRIKRFREENKEILDKFEKFRMMWEDLIALELKANDPNRFTNRGGQLLLEEKKRKAIQKGLPKIEKELLVLNEKYAEKSENNAKFKVYGDNLDEYISGCWDELNRVKEEEKKERQRAKMRKPIQQAQPLVRKTPLKRMPSPLKRSRATPNALSISEQEFEDLIVACPASAKKAAHHHQ